MVYRVALSVIRDHRLRFEEEVLWSDTLEDVQTQLQEYLKSTNLTVFSQMYKRTASNEHEWYNWELIGGAEHNKFD